MKILTRFLSLSALLILVGAGCNPIESLTKKAQEKAGKAAVAGVEGSIENSIKQATGKDVDVSLGNKGATYTDPETGTTFSVGEAVTIPADFPSDLPRYPNGSPKSVSVTENGRDATLLVETTDARADTRAWLEAEFPKAGWTSEGAIENLDMIILTFSRSENGGTARAVATLSAPNVQNRINVVVTRKGVKGE